MCPRRDLNPQPTDYAYHYGFRHAPQVLRRRNLWSGLSLRVTRLPSSLYTFRTIIWCGLARDYRVAFAIEASPNLADSTSAPEQPRIDDGVDVIRLQPNFGGRMEVICLVCKAHLSGKQSKFCSRQCKNAFTNNKYQNYVSQQRRGRNCHAEIHNPEFST